MKGVLGFVKSSFADRRKFCEVWTSQLHMSHSDLLNVMHFTLCNFLRSLGLHKLAKSDFTRFAKSEQNMRTACEAST